MMKFVTVDISVCKNCVVKVYNNYKSINTHIHVYGIKYKTYGIDKSIIINTHIHVYGIKYKTYYFSYNS
jgi:hypothetical protein